MNKRLQVIKYITTDVLSAMLAWSLFYVFRKTYIEPKKFGYDVGMEFSTTFFIGLICIPLFWLFMYYLIGTYKDIYRKSRLKELGQTLFISLVGVIIIFFTLLLDDEIASYKNYYLSFAVLFGLHFLPTFFFRFIWSSITAHRIHNKIIGFNTLLVGSNKKAKKLFNEMQDQKKSSGFKFVGYVHINGGDGQLLKETLPHLGHIKDIRSLIHQHKIEEVVLAMESSEHESIGKVINQVEGENVYVKVIPDMYDILSGSVKMSSIFGTPLIEIRHEIMPVWQQSLKRVIDIFVSMFVLTCFSWLYAVLAIGVKLTSKGPVFYSHERIGRYGKPFTIYKFRSMCVNAEKSLPQLSSENDSRITAFGRFLRKTRLDEIPQFYNVLIGDMSLVGPRPERQFFIDQITQEAPHYAHLHKVRPGITSWGQVKFGYAENVEEMIERLKYDIIYIENMSLFVDIKILIYTILTVLQGRGK